jgi:hypothetical protein
MGFDVVYDPNILKYSGYIKRQMVKKFDMFDVNKIRAGLLRVGGIEAGKDLIQAGKSGEIFRLRFEVIAQGNQTLQLVKLKDDISAWGVAKVQPAQKKKENEYR